MMFEKLAILVYLIVGLRFFLLNLDIVAIIERERRLVIGLCMFEDWVILG